MEGAPLPGGAKGMKAILGFKRGMSQVFTETGQVVPVTVVEAGPCPVVQVKTPEKDGYKAYQIAFGPIRPKRVAKPQAGHFKKAGVEPRRFLREVRVEGEEVTLKPGDQVTVADFQVGELVDVVAVSKGRGYQGTVKRHGFSRGPESHGSMNVRRPGSIGQSSYPSRVFKGTRMSGHMGNRRITVKNQRLVLVDPEKNLIALKGQIPGPVGGLVFLKQAKHPKAKGGA